MLLPWLLLTQAVVVRVAATSTPPLIGLAPHPRLVLTDAGLAALRVSIATYPSHAAIAASVSALASSYLTTPLTSYPNCTVVGACRNAAVFGAGASYLNAGGASSIIVTCALEHRLNGSSTATPFSDRAVAELLHVCTDWASWYWPVGQALERAEVAYGAGIGYDWLYGVLTPAQRATVEQALGVLALETRLRDEREGMWWLRDGLNWAVNANAPLLAAALAVADTPRWAGAAARVVDTVLADLVPAVALFSPSGVWPEGPSYASYTLLSLTEGCAALGTSGATPPGAAAVCDWPVRQRGVCGAGGVALAAAGPAGGTFNYGDASPGSVQTGTLFFAATACRTPAYAAAARSIRARDGGGKLEDLLWFSPAGDAADLAGLPLASVFADPATPKTHVATLRSGRAWGGSTPDAASFVAVKGGLNAYNEGNSCNDHGHLDVGSFVMEALGVRWVVDLGADAYDYPLLAYFGRFRFGYFRTSSVSHNVLRFDVDTQHREGAGAIVAHNVSGSSGSSGAVNDWVTINATTAYGGAARVTRTVRLLGAAACARVVIEDTWAHETATTATWTVHTPAAVDMASGAPVLSANGQSLALSASGTGVVWRSVLVDIPAPQTSGYGEKGNTVPVYAVSATLPASAGALTVTLTPLCAP